MFTCIKTNRVVQYNRNQKCKCGSGKKNKNCCKYTNTYEFVDKRKIKNITKEENNNEQTS